MKVVGKSVLWVIAAVVVCAVSSQAQVTWLKNYYGKGASIEYGNGTGEAFNDNNSSGYSSSGYSLIITSHNTLNPAFQLIGQLPLAHGSFDFMGESSSSFTIGNFYFGVEGKHPYESSTLFRAGVRLPSAPDASDEQALALAFGSVINYEQFEAYFPKMLAFHADFGYQFIFGEEDAPTRTLLRLTGGGSYMKPKDFDGAFFGDADIEWWFEAKKVSVGVGSILRYDITEDNVDNRLNLISGATLMGTFGSFCPQISVRVPMTKDLTDFVDLTYSIALGYDVR